MPLAARAISAVTSQACGDRRPPTAPWTTFGMPSKAGGRGRRAWASRPSLPDARSDLLDCAVDVTRCRQGASHGATTSQPRRCSSPASSSGGSRRRSCSALDSRSSVSAGGSAMASDVACSRSISSSASARVNLPAAWRCVNRIGPRASRKLSWPAACSAPAARPPDVTWQEDRRADRTA